MGDSSVAKAMEDGWLNGPYGMRDARFRMRLFLLPLVARHLSHTGDNDNNDGNNA